MITCNKRNSALAGLHHKYSRLVCCALYAGTRLFYWAIPRNTCMHELYMISLVYTAAVCLNLKRKIVLKRIIHASLVTVRRATF